MGRKRRVVSGEKKVRGVFVCGGENVLLVFRVESQGSMPIVHLVSGVTDGAHTSAAIENKSRNG